MAHPAEFLCKAHTQTVGHSHPPIILTLRLAGITCSSSRLISLVARLNALRGQEFTEFHGRRSAVCRIDTYPDIIAGLGRVGLFLTPLNLKYKDITGSQHGR